MTIDNIVLSRRIIIVCGSGGVGKTTVSASIALRGAQLGKKVVVLTIDPAKRLAQALGYEDLPAEPELISKVKAPGELYGCMLDVKKTFDDFIRRLSPSDDLAEKVLNNAVYKQISTTISGSQEYTALEKLVELYQSKKFDLIVLDTPPTQHAIDFLESPTKIHSLFQDTILRWFLTPFSTLDRLTLGFMNRGTKMAFKAFEAITGAEFLASLMDFFSVIKVWQRDLMNRVLDVQMLLCDKEKTAFVLVTSFAAAKINEAAHFSKALKKGGFNLSSVIVNRALPIWEVNEKFSEGIGELGDSDKESLKKLITFYNDLNNLYAYHERAFKSFLAQQESEIDIVKIPDFEQEANNFVLLEDMTKHLAESRG